MAAQKELWKIQGARRTWFCGAYWGSGFHEDGIQAGLAVAEALGGVRRPWSVAGRIRAASISDRNVPKPRPSRKPQSKMPETCLYRGEVVHRRLNPVRHELRYRVFNLFADVDRLEDTGASVCGCSATTASTCSPSWTATMGRETERPIREHAWKLVRDAEGGEHVTPRLHVLLSERAGLCLQSADRLLRL